METGLLESLKKYRLREGRDSLENFITEAFAWILKNHPDFSEYFLDRIMENPNMLLPEIDKKNCKWFTEYLLDKPSLNMVFRLDMVCLSNNNAIVFEHKVNANLSHNQLQKYKDSAANKFGDSKVVLITAQSSQHSQDPDLALCWYDIYNLIDDWLQKNTDTVAKFIFKDFLKLLKSENLDPGEPISHESIKLYDSLSNDYKKDIKIQKNIANLIKRVENEDWSLNIREGYEKFIQQEIPRYKYGKRWGRMGLDLLVHCGVNKMTIK
jgi:hypothetical protein